MEWANFDLLVLEVKMQIGEILKETSEEWIGMRKAYMPQEAPEQPSTDETE